MKKYILAHDLGTSGNKASLFSVEGKMMGSKVVPYDVHYFNGTWAEQNAEDWWDAVCASTKELILSLNIQPADIAAVSFSGQMMGCLCVDRNGRPLRPSIIWADQRAQMQSAQIGEHISQQDFYHIVGHRNTASYGIQKLMWVRDNEPDIYEQTYKMLNAKDFIVFRLTGKFYTEYSDGNGCGCFDLQRLTWSERIIEYAKIDGDKLPELKPSTFVAGDVTAEAAQATGLVEGTPVVLGGGDGVTASIGAGSVSPGKTYCCMGTSAWVMTASEKPLFDEDMRTVTWAHIVPGLYAPNGTMQCAGGAYNWVRGALCQYEVFNAKHGGPPAYRVMDEEVQKSPVGSNGVIFLPYLLGERAPRWDETAKGAYIGLKTETVRGDLLRSTLEGITMNLSICLDILRKSVEINEILSIGGGSKSRVWRQIMADIFNVEVKVPTVLEEAGSMGAAIVGGVGVGLYPDFDVYKKFIHIESEQLPDPKAVAGYIPIKKLYDDCYFSLKDVFKRM